MAVPGSWKVRCPGQTAGVSMKSGTSIGTETPLSPVKLLYCSKFFRSVYGVLHSYRSPRFTVSFELTFQSSWTKNAVSFDLLATDLNSARLLLPGSP